jgi:hypothetical protein
MSGGERRRVEKSRNGMGRGGRIWKARGGERRDKLLDGIAWECYHLLRHFGGGGSHFYQGFSLNYRRPFLLISVSESFLAGFAFQFK